MLLFGFHHYTSADTFTRRQLYSALSFSVRRSAYSHIIRVRPVLIGTAGFEPASQVGDEPLIIYRQSSTIKLRSEISAGRFEHPPPAERQALLHNYTIRILDTHVPSPFLHSLYTTMLLRLLRVMGLEPTR